MHNTHASGQVSFSDINKKTAQRLGWMLFFFQYAVNKLLKMLLITQQSYKWSRDCISSVLRILHTGTVFLSKAAMAFE